MKIRIVDKYGLSKIINVEEKVEILYYMSACGKIRFELHDIPKHGVPIFKQVSDL